MAVSVRGLEIISAVSAEPYVGTAPVAEFNYPTDDMWQKEIVVIDFTLDAAPYSRTMVISVDFKTYEYESGDSDTIHRKFRLYDGNTMLDESIVSYGSWDKTKWRDHAPRSFFETVPANQTKSYQIRYWMNSSGHPTRDKQITIKSTSFVRTEAEGKQGALSAITFRTPATDQ